jgi:hypothetical protein
MDSPYDRYQPLVLRRPRTRSYSVER